ncbi:ABC transporter permease [Cognatilysobacter segetis]|uniref:ABC transporter permease n=1 Tax=Cognatilysobacter segetis TaxID=2492394 RepID=UPI00138FE994|nr:FtsX-like permease family protein [Lysobacter segetis]
MTALARKRRRDLWRLRGQVLAIALVAGVGVANLVMSRSTLESLVDSRDRYYRAFAFADAFAELRRAPEAVGGRLASVPGVARVQTRVTALGRAELPGFDEPIRVQALSLPESGRSALNRLRLREGRVPGDAERDAVVVSDAFADAHGLRPGSRIVLVLHGHRSAFRIAGIGASPEFVSQGAPGALFPDARRFAIVWMPRRSLAAAVDMDGAFDSVALALAHGANARQVIADVDAILAPYGGAGAITRADQRSHRYLSEELRQLETLARLFPAVFLGVAAYVLYVVLGRLVAVEREQIGTLRAFGFSPRELWRHYAGFAVTAGLLGAVIGIALGMELGRRVADLYRDYYRLPSLDFRVLPAVLANAVVVSLASALLGATVPLLRVARLAPADAMRPDVPWQGGRRRLAPLRLLQRLAQMHRLMLRDLATRPLRSLLAWVGLAFGTAVMMMGRFQHDAIDYMIERQFRPTERQDLSLAFFEPVAPRALREIAAIPGVQRVEAERAVPVRIAFRSAGYRTVLRGLEDGMQLRRPLDASGSPIAPPSGGIVLTDYLARWLGAAPGQVLQVEVLSGRRPVLMLPLAGTVEEPFGSQAYMRRATLDRALGEGPRIDGAQLAVDANALRDVHAQLARRPAVASLDRPREAILNFYEGMARTVLTFTVISTLFGAVITAGVTYSSAQVALSERARDLASLRILGFTRAEVGYLLLGELALLVMLAVPLGFVLGHGLIAALVHGFDSDLFRIPRYISPSTYGIAALTTFVSAAAATVPVWRRVSSLDLVAVLKARD